MRDRPAADFSPALGTADFKLSRAPPMSRVEHHSRSPGVHRMSAPAARVLVIDDTPEARITVKAVLGRERYELFEADSGQTGLEVARRIVPDLVVLDLGLPDIDGIEVCRALRTFSDAYVIMLTARDREMDILSGLTIGADDYMTKPFSPLELAARVRAAFRRAAARSVAPIGEKIYRFGDLTVDTKRREARVAGEKVQLCLLYTSPSPRD